MKNLHRTALTLIAALALGAAAANPAAADSDTAVAAPGSEAAIGDIGCTISFVDRNLVPGQLWAYTATHCYAGKGANTVVRDAKGSILGSVRPSVSLPELPIDDMGQNSQTLLGIQLVNDAIVSDDLPNGTHLVDADTARPAFGTRACFYGKNSGERCGTINYSGSAPTLHLNVPAQHGDSGAPMYVYTGQSTAKIVGIVIGFNEPTGVTYAFPMAEIRDALSAQSSTRAWRWKPTLT